MVRTEQALRYGYPPRKMKGDSPPDRTPAAHGERLHNQLLVAKQAADKRRDGLTLRFDIDFPESVLSLEDHRGRQVIEVLNIGPWQDGTARVTVFVARGKLETLEKKITAYRDETTPVKGRPKNERMCAGIVELRNAVLEDCWTDTAPFPADETAPLWWEVWLWRHDGVAAADDLAEAQGLAEAVGMRLLERHLIFPERIVVLGQGSIAQWRDSIRLLDKLAELRSARPLASAITALSPREAAEYVDHLAHRISQPPPDAPAVCILDHGVHQGHPLIAVAMDEADLHTADVRWPVASPSQQHGTEMAGLALYGDDLQDLLVGTASLPLVHRLESVRILPPGDGRNDPELYGSLTRDAVDIAATAAPHRERVACLAVCDECNAGDGVPTGWSAAVDAHAAGADFDVDDPLAEGRRHLYTISAGNVWPLSPGYAYPDSCVENGVLDPGQSWNALTVGAFTERSDSRDPAFADYHPLASPGSLSPSSRTSVGWRDTDWPFKPEIVMEGGNYAEDFDGRVDTCDDLQLLTTVFSGSRLLHVIGDTSAATAQAARLAAIIQAEYPNAWPETVRGLLVHSARWTRRMEDETAGNGQTPLVQRLRRYGYGVPDLERARWSWQNQVTLIHQGALRPFDLARDANEQTRSGEPVLCQWHRHPLPWPEQALLCLGAARAIVRVTLSYFVEPNPSSRGWRRKFAYQSHGLRFKLRGPAERDELFRKRISAAQREEDEDISHSDPVTWALGDTLQRRGSIHSDWFESTAADLARCGCVAVFPVGGWWKYRHHLGRWPRPARYSLIVTIETPEDEVDLYAEVENAITVAAPAG